MIERDILSGIVEESKNQDVKQKPRMLFVNDETYLLMTYSHQFIDKFEVHTAENGL
jgi:hypothetical protein